MAIVARAPVKEPGGRVLGAVLGMQVLGEEFLAGLNRETGLYHNLYADGVRLFVEAGPRGNLSAFVEDTLRGRPFAAFGVEDHEDYHRPSDESRTITRPFFVAATRTVIDAVRALDASSDELARRRG